MKIILTVATLLSINAFADGRTKLFVALGREAAEIHASAAAAKFQKAFTHTRIALDNNEWAAKMAAKGLSPKEIEREAYRAGRGTLKDTEIPFDKGRLPDNSEYFLTMTTERKDGVVKTFMRFQSDSKDDELMYKMVKGLESSNTKFDKKKGEILVEVNDPKYGAKYFELIKKTAMNDLKMAPIVRRPTQRVVEGVH